MAFPKISLQQLFHTLLEPTRTADYSSLPDDPGVATTVRLDGETRRFYENTAKALDISLQSMINIALKGLMQVSQSDARSSLNLMVDRFFYLFSLNNIPIASIPDFIKPLHLQRSRLANHDALIDALDDQFISKIALTFGVSKAWLQGESSKMMYPNREWYKNVHCFCEYLLEIYHPKMRLLFIADSSHEDLLKEKSNDSVKSHVGIVIEKSHKSEFGHQYTTYELLPREPWGYKQSRLDYKTIIMFCLQEGIKYKGYFIGKDNAAKLFSGAVHPHELFGDYQPSFQTFYIDDYATYGFSSDRDSDEIMDVVNKYCKWWGLNKLQNKENSRRYSLGNLDLSKFDDTKDQTIEDLILESVKCARANNAGKETV